MKFRLLLALLLPLTAFADETAVTSSIKDVTVFLSGAEIHREARVTVVAGKTTLKFTDLTGSLVPSTVQVKGSNVTILQVTHQLNYLKDGPKPPRVVQLEDSLDLLEGKLNYNTNLKKVYAEERALILANKSVKGDNTVLLMEDIEDIADFYRNRLTTLFEMEMNLDRENKKLHKQRTRVQQQLNEHRARMNRTTSEVLVEVQADVPSRCDLELSYMTYNARWSPYYDLRAADTNEPVEMNYRAMVNQHTGVDWEKVNLVLSTGNPAVDNSKPIVSKWELDYYQDVDYGYVSNRYFNTDLEGADRKEEDKGREAEAMQYDALRSLEDALTEPDNQLYAKVQAVKTDLAVEFAIKVPYDIPSDGKDHQVHIQDNMLTAHYEHYIAPKVEQDAFLLARITGWDELNMISGPANIYFQGTYVGKSFINTNQTNDTLDLSLGRDNSIVVTRKRIKDLTEKKTLGGTVRETMGIEITIRNQKGTPVNAIIEDQIPVSKNKDIVVEMTENSNAKYTEDTGMLKWKATIEPSGVRKFIFVYSVKYPKGRDVRL